ncbi:metallophosphoesterase family protein [Paenibacillus flagellatus]|nr:metallophosphoesterase family protein [Paenibacillus flagellatus]
MKLLILSDIHSNMDSLEAIMEQEPDSDEIYCAGDLVDVGFRPQDVVHWARSRNVVCVQGNHDRLVVETYRSGLHLQDVPPAELTWPILNARWLDEASIVYLESLPERVDFEIDGAAYSMQHMYNGYETIVCYSEFKSYWSRQTGEKYRDNPRKRLIFGHTHRQSVTYLDNECLWLNPGSVGYNRPDDPSNETHYMTIMDGRIEMKRLPHKNNMSRDELRRRFAELYRK